MDCIPRGEGKASFLGTPGPSNFPSLLSATGTWSSGSLSPGPVRDLCWSPVSTFSVGRSAFAASPGLSSVGLVGRGPGCTMRTGHGRSRPASRDGGGWGLRTPLGWRASHLGAGVDLVWLGHWVWAWSRVLVMGVAPTLRTLSSSYSLAEGLSGLFHRLRWVGRGSWTARFAELLSCLPLAL